MKKWLEKAASCRPENYSPQTALFSILHYSLHENETPFPQAAVNYLTDSLHQGNIMSLWVIGFLIQKDIMEKPDGIIRNAYSIIGRNSAAFSESPFRYNPHDDIYPFGVTMMTLLTTDDTTARYTWEEQIILRLCDCQKILTQRVPGMHNPTWLTASQLHSILAFAIEARSRKVFPVKAEEIINLIKAAEPCATNSTASDAFILNYLCNHKHSSSDLTATDLDRIGFYSIMYNRPDIFRAAVNRQ